MNPNPKNQPPRQRQPLRFQRRRETALVFSPLAWLKLQMFLHAGDTEVGGFGLSSEEDLLYVQDFITLDQVTSSVTVEFADTAVANYFDSCVDAGIPPARFARIWMHTHPGSSPEPSSVDEETFARVFGNCDWGLMFIMGRTGKTYARLSFNTGPGGSILLPVSVDWAQWPSVVMDQQDHLPELFEQWMNEFDQNIHPYQPPITSSDNLSPSRMTIEDWWHDFRELADDRMFDVVDQSELAELIGGAEVSHVSYE
jgi:proteasome lid subunit RPN8/RPN11